MSRASEAVHVLDEWSIPARKVEIARARHHVRKLIEKLATADQVSDDAVLCFDELVSNSVLHSESVEIGIRVCDTGTAVRIEVSDAGHGHIPVEQTDPGVASESGRGLLIVDALAGRHGVVAQAAGRTWWFEVDHRGA